MKMSRSLSLGFAAALLAVSADGAAAQTGPLFPEPFRVEHHLVQDDGDGSPFVGEPVTDTYGGSWIVSQRPDGSRLIVDLARRELTEVRPGKGEYWTVSFDRFAELQAQLRAAQVTRVEPEAAEKKAADTPAEPEELVVTELAVEKARGGTSAEAPGVRRLAVSAKGKPDGQAMEVWVDPSVRLTPNALEALDSFEARLAGPRQLAAARKFAQGAFAVRTARPAGPEGIGRIEDVTTKLERLERFPSELAEIPEGLKRVPHPLEAVVRFLAEDAERNLVLSGREGGSKP
jgi:hypothetical protein